MAFVAWADRILEIYDPQVDMDIQIAKGEYMVPSNAAPLGVNPETYRDVFPLIPGNDEQYLQHDDDSDGDYSSCPPMLVDRCRFRDLVEKPEELL